MSDKNLHPIQKAILVALMQSPTGMRFSNLLPEDMKLESDRFNYHLKNLVKLGYIKKNLSNYILTQEGLKLISKYTATGGTVSTPKVSVALFVFRNNKNEKEILLQDRLRHPFFGDTNSIAGKVKIGEYAKDCAKRKLREEAGLEADFTYIGTLRKVRYTENSEILEDTVYLYFIAENPTGDLVEINEYGKNYWVPIEHAAYLMQNNYDSGEKDFDLLKKIIAGNTSIFYEEEFREVKGYTK